MGPSTRCEPVPLVGVGVGAGSARLEKGSSPAFEGLGNGGYAEEASAIGKPVIPFGVARGSANSLLCGVPRYI